MNVIEVNNLTKDYGSGRGVFDVSIAVNKGEVFGFLGPNGAGKSTTIRHLMGFSKPDSGETLIFGKPTFKKYYEILDKVGYIPGEIALPAGLTGYEFIRMMQDMQGVKNDAQLKRMLDMFELSDEVLYGDTKRMSLGVKRKLAVVTAFMHDPEVLILDEPTNGLDPAGMKQIRDLLKTLCSEYGITVMISSHILSEVESIADTVAIIHHGKMMKEIRMQDIEEMNLNYVELSVTDEKRAAYVLTEKLGLQNFKILDSGKIRIYDHAASTQQLTKILALNDVEIVSIGKKSETLEDYFLKLTGEVKYHA